MIAEWINIQIFSLIIKNLFDIIVVAVIKKIYFFKILFEKYYKLFLYSLIIKILK